MKLVIHIRRSNHVHAEATWLLNHQAGSLRGTMSFYLDPKKNAHLPPSFAVSYCNLVAAPEPDDYTRDHVHTNRAEHIVLVD